MSKNNMTVKVDFQSIDSSNSPEAGDELVFNKSFMHIRMLERLKSFFQSAQNFNAGRYTCALAVSEELFSAPDDCDWRYDEAVLVVGLNHSDKGGDVFVTQKLIGKYDSADFIESEAFSMDAIISWIKDELEAAA